MPLIFNSLHRLLLKLLLQPLQVRHCTERISRAHLELQLQSDLLQGRRVYGGCIPRTLFLQIVVSPQVEVLQVLSLSL